MLYFIKSLGYSNIWAVLYLCALLTDISYINKNPFAVSKVKVTMQLLWFGFMSMR